LFAWLDSLRGSYSLIGPVTEDGQTEFRELGSAGEMDLGYQSTMLSPGKVYLYKPREDLFRFTFGSTIEIREEPVDPVQRMIVGLHACDTNAVRYLDRTFLGSFCDPQYEARRNNTFIISLNCTTSGENCFCASVGAGPFLDTGEGYDMLLTDLGDDVLAELKSERARTLFPGDGFPRAGEKAFRRKQELEQAVLRSFRKSIEMDGLNDLLRKRPDHPVWRSTAEESCLSCTNCVMVCPTCFCYDVVDEINMDLKSVRRYRQWDACQDLHFAEVHGGNFRARRTARLRQFATHKLDQTHQYGVYGTVGCGRCITWCPTGIDITDMAKEVQKSESP
jgi:formate hydrogenlyase subunit 6/NADH:ubiquinone oxidoreductase subunit I